MVEAVSVIISSHQMGDGVACGIGASAAVSQSPAQLISIVLSDDAASPALSLAAQVDVPIADVLVDRSLLVANLQVAHVASVQVAHHDVALRSLAVDVHQARFRDVCVALRRQHHLDLQVVEVRPC